MFSRIRLTGLLLLCALLTGCVQTDGVSAQSGDVSSAQSGDVSSAQPGDVSSAQSGDVSSAQSASAAAPVPEYEPWPDPDCLPPPPDPSPYDFSQPVPESASVELEYFDDAAFVGDSRTDGFLLYSGIGRGANLTSNGLSIFSLNDKKALSVGGVDYTAIEALGLKEYGKVYFSLGINELGTYDDEDFFDNYCQAIDDIRACQPDAVVYIQGLIPLNEEKIKASGGRDYLKNDHLRVYNDLMRRAAQEKQVVFLDLYEAFVQEDGQIPFDASRDGVHLTKDYCRKWLEYLQEHTVDFDTLYSNRVEAPQET